MAVALDPSICVAGSEHYVDVEVTSDLTRGMTVVDRLGIAGNRRNSAIWSEVIEKGSPLENGAFSGAGIMSAD
jgi:purine nucleosidase